MSIWFGHNSTFLPVTCFKADVITVQTTTRQSISKRINYVNVELNFRLLKRILFKFSMPRTNYRFTHRNGHKYIMNNTWKRNTYMQLKHQKAICLAMSPAWREYVNASENLWEIPQSEELSIFLVTCEPSMLISHHCLDQWRIKWKCFEAIRLFFLICLRVAILDVMSSGVRFSY